ncbi:MAG: bifunctional riboflavin kinase/FAD synthetase [Bacteroidales bacterium]
MMIGERKMGIYYPKKIGEQRYKKTRSFLQPQNLLTLRTVMQIFYFPQTPPTQALAVTTGFFDGVHRGHTTVIRSLVERAQKNNLPSCVLTYEPHPRSILQKDKQIHLLTCLDEKSQRIADLGVDYMVVVPFSQELAQTKIDVFFENFLLKSLHTQILLVGFDHSFGENASKNLSQIQRLCSQHSLEFVRIKAFSYNDTRISSSKIRQALLKGDIVNANEWLSYNYTISGRVVKGNAIGRNIGFPTANIQPHCSEKLLPKNGVYAALVTVNQQTYKAMLNIGTRPTVCNENAVCIEAHLFNFSENIYDCSATITIINRLRDEYKMPTLDSLKSQLKQDKIEAINLLANQKFI